MLSCLWLLKTVVDDLPLIAEDGAEAVTQALVAVGVTVSPLDLESAMTKSSLKRLLSINSAHRRAAFNLVS